MTSISKLMLRRRHDGGHHQVPCPLQDSPRVPRRPARPPSESCQPQKRPQEVLPRGLLLSLHGQGCLMSCTASGLLQQILLLRLLERRHSNKYFVFHKMGNCICCGSTCGFCVLLGLLVCGLPKFNNHFQEFLCTPTTCQEGYCRDSFVTRVRLCVVLCSSGMRSPVQVSHPRRRSRGHTRTFTSVWVISSANCASSGLSQLAVCKDGVSYRMSDQFKSASNILALLLQHPRLRLQ